VTEALTAVLDPGVLLVVVLAAFYGVIVGAIPGLTATMAVALFVPLAYHLDAVHAVAAVVTLVACAIFAGDIPNALLRIPGTPASAAYTDEVHALAKRGLADQALGVCLAFSVTGGLLGALLLMLFAQSLARVAALFAVPSAWFSASACRRSAWGRPTAPSGSPSASRSSTEGSASSPR
jgi:putative tricarboxylic transport membrane protein